MSGGEALVPIVLFVSTAASTFGIWYLRSRENMALIDRGINPRQAQTSLPRPFGNLKYGLLLLGGGLGLTLAFLLDNLLPHTSVSGVSFEALYFSLLAVGGGLGLIASYSIERKAWEQMKKDMKEEEI